MDRSDDDTAGPDRRIRPIRECVCGCGRSLQSGHTLATRCRRSAAIDRAVAAVADPLRSSLYSTTQALQSATLRGNVARVALVRAEATIAKMARAAAVAADEADKVMDVSAAMVREAQTATGAAVGRHTALCAAQAIASESHAAMTADRDRMAAAAAAADRALDSERDRSQIARLEVARLVAMLERERPPERRWPPLRLSARGAVAVGSVAILAAIAVVLA